MAISACIRLTGLTAAIFVAWVALSAALAAEPKRVMLLHSFGPDVKPWSDYARAIRSELKRQSPWPLDLYEFSLVTSRFSDQNPEIPFVEYLSALFAKHRLDLIVSIGAPAAGFVQRQRQRLFSATPMVFTVVDQRRVQYSVLTPNDAVVAVAINYFRAFENILHVLPDTKHVVGIVGSSPIEKYWKEEIGREIAPLTDRFALTWTNELSFEDILKHAAALQPGSAIFWELMVVDAAGVSHEEGRALTLLHAVANAPIFSYTDAFFGREIVGGPHVPVLEAGKRTAEVAMRILSGEQAGDIKVPPVEFGAPKFDWREMQRWGISEGQLPPGSEIHFRSPTIWEQHRVLILAAAAAVLIQGGLIMWLLYEHRRRQVAEVLARNTMSELTHMNRMASAGELSASIAHEVNQPLAAVTVYAHAALNWLTPQRLNVEEVRSALHQIMSASLRAGEIIKNVRAMFKDDTLEKVPVGINRLILTVLSLVRIDLQKHDIEVETELDDVPTIEGNPVQLQQVIMNLVVNAAESMQAAEPRLLRIRTGLSKPGMLRVSIEDSGTGIDSSDLDRIFQPLFTTKARGMGIGLSICRSVIERHGGRIWASSAPTRGSIFQFELPVTGHTVSKLRGAVR